MYILKDSLVRLVIPSVNNIFIKHFSLSSVQEKEENMKTIEGLLEKGLIEVANKEEELKVSVFYGFKKNIAEGSRASHTHTSTFD